MPFPIRVSLAPFPVHPCKSGVAGLIVGRQPEFEARFAGRPLFAPVPRRERDHRFRADSLKDQPQFAPERAEGVGDGMEHRPPSGPCGGIGELPGDFALAHGRAGRIAKRDPRSPGGAKGDEGVCLVGHEEILVAGEGEGRLGGWGARAIAGARFEDGTGPGTGLRRGLHDTRAARLKREIDEAEGEQGGGEQPGAHGPRHGGEASRLGPYPGHIGGGGMDEREKRDHAHRDPADEGKP